MKPDDPMEQLKQAPDVRHHDVVFPATNTNNHAWVQRGFTMHCDGFGHHAPHGHHLNHDEHLTGLTSDGLPIIEKITVDEPQNVA